MKPGDMDKIYAVLKEEFSKHAMPVVDLIQVQSGSPFKILTATILSARTKDETTSKAAERLFARAEDLESLKLLSAEELEKIIYPVGFYKQKAKYLAELPYAADRLYGGTIPDTVEELVELPGVGRKTANLVVALAFKKPAICVDIHVHRINNRLGYVSTSEPFQTEMKLREILPEEYWITINAYMVSFGQNTCRPTNPKCSICPIYTLCGRIGVTKSR